MSTLFVSLRQIGTQFVLREQIATLPAQDETVTEEFGNTSQHPMLNLGKITEKSKYPLWQI